MVALLWNLVAVLTLLTCTFLFLGEHVANEVVNTNTRNTNQCKNSGCSNVHIIHRTSAGLKTKVPTLNRSNKHTLSHDNLNSTNNISIVVQLSGELGNQLSKLAYGICLKWYAKQFHNISTHLVLRAQSHAKWYNAKEDTQACFPLTRAMDFQQGNTIQFQQQQEQQKEWLGKSDAAHLHLNDCCTKACVDQSLEHLAKVLARPPQNNTFATKNTIGLSASFPFLYTETFANAECFFVDLYYEELRKIFAFDTSICKQTPKPDEIILHIRNFLKEMPRRGKLYGFEELSPNQTATELFESCAINSKIAIISRIPQGLGNYQIALQAKGYNTRIVDGQSGIEDFCLLLKAEQEIIGVSSSTFVLYAGILGNSSQVRLYSLDSPSRRGFKSLTKFFPHFSFTNQQLKHRISFQLIQAQ